MPEVFETFIILKAWAGCLISVPYRIGMRRGLADVQCIVVPLTSMNNLEIYASSLSSIKSHYSGVITKIFYLGDGELEFNFGGFINDDEATKVIHLRGTQAVKCLLDHTLQAAKRGKFYNG